MISKREISIMTGIGLYHKLWNQKLSRTESNALREKCPYSKFFLVHIFPYWVIHVFPYFEYVHFSGSNVLWNGQREKLKWNLIFFCYSLPWRKILSNFLVLHRFRRVLGFGNSAFLQNVHTRKFGEIAFILGELFYAVFRLLIKLLSKQ